jgi:hypothetical protein
MTTDVFSNYYHDFGLNRRRSNKVGNVFSYDYILLLLTVSIIFDKIKRLMIGSIENFE